ncbi:hypothetical protein C8J56DRAFT_892514 [Mycena floridula]|nr:hypothetical protein C8J56DRAFT_892514 [Mycena floridula]
MLRTNTMKQSPSATPAQCKICDQSNLKTHLMKHALTVILSPTTPLPVRAIELKYTGKQPKPEDSNPQPVKQLSLPQRALHFPIVNRFKRRVLQHILSIVISCFFHRQLQFAIKQSGDDIKLGISFETLTAPSMVSSAQTPIFHSLTPEHVFPTVFDNTVWPCQHQVDLVPTHQPATVLHQFGDFQQQVVVEQQTPFWRLIVDPSY